MGMFRDVVTLSTLAAAAITVAGGLAGYSATRRVRQAERRERAARLAVEQLEAVDKQHPPDQFAHPGLSDHPAGPPEPPDALVTSCIAGDSVLFAGTGLSAALGQPTWREALLGVLHRCEENHPEPLWKRLIGEVQDEQYDLVADLLVEKLGSATFYAYLREVLEPTRDSGRSSERLLRDPLRSRSSERLLDPLRKIPFSGAIANVWDDVVEGLFAHREPAVLGPGSSEFAEVLRQDRFFVLNAYGTLADDSLLVTADAFEEYLSDHLGYARFLGSIFGTRTVLFVGAGVSGIEHMLRGTGVRGADGGRRHYALVPWSTEAALHLDRLLHRYNVELLLYPPQPGHPAVGEFLRKLAAKVHQRRRDAETKRKAKAAPLTALRLANVGPFDELELDFAEDWTVLLADNGCGKSTILRSIALALCGDDERAVRAGGRLLKANAEHGSIQVRFGADIFETRLVREATQVRVLPRQITPVQTGEWLVLGFPAIRGVSLRGPGRGSGVIRRGPEVDDVLPLVASEVDSRLDDLTQWLLSTIYSSAATGSRRGKLGAPATVDRFFRVMSRLGSDIDLRFGGIDDEALEVLVVTPDGRVPLHSVSQGMNSILTWTGSLISRLEEVEQESDQRGGRAGLIMIDEIDAHLHPSWQRQIIDAAHAEFPNVQFLVTTHSPLVVGSMAEGKLWRLFRDEENRVLGEEFGANFRGWRADQILTSPVFDTDVRDPGTERLFEDYESLAALEEPSGDQLKRLREAAAALEVRLPNPEQTEDARRARSLIEMAAAAEIAGMADKERERVLGELKRQVQEAIVGSKPQP
jgi:predicted ATPase